MTMHVKPDAKPYAIHAPHSIPIAWRDIVKCLTPWVLKVFSPLGNEGTPWCHPLVCVPKESGDIRISVDLLHLN